MTVQVLTIELLDGLERRWNAAGAPIAAHLQAGLTDAEMDALVAPLGVSLPTEARTWWGWHNGVDILRPGLEIEADIGGGLNFWSLEYAVEQYTELREIYLDPYGEEPGSPSLRNSEAALPPSRLPFLSGIGSGLTVWLECDVSLGAPSPVYAIEADSLAEIYPRTPDTDSLGDLVASWQLALDTGTWRYAGRPRWIRDSDRWPPGLPRHDGLM